MKSLDVGEILPSSYEYRKGGMYVFELLKG